MDFLLRPITKQEEQHAFQYIKDKLVPRAVQAYNQRPDAEKKVTADEIRKALRKIASDPGSRRSTDDGPYVLYVAHLTEPNTDHIWKFHFTISRASKNSRKPGGIMVHCRFPVAAMCGAYLQESIDPSKEQALILSKLDEQRGLQYIRERVVPSTVASWNKAVDRSKLREKETYKLTADDVNKTLIKKQHYQHNPGDRTRKDWIQYESTPIKSFVLKGPFIFSLSKDNFVGELSVAAALPGSEDFTTFYMSEDNAQKTMDPIRRGVNIKEEVEKDDPLNVRIFTRREEGEVFQYLKLTVIPYLVTRKNKILWAQTKRRSNFKVADVLRTLRKVNQVDTKHGRALYFKAEAQNQSYNLMVYKDGEGDTLVYNKDNGAMYQVGRPIKQDSIDTGEFYNELEEVYEPSEEDIANAIPITKQEEMAAVDYIKKIMIPSLLQHYNQYKDNHLYEPISPDTVRQHLKKDAVYLDYANPGLTVRYVAKVPSKFGKGSLWEKEFKFYITKDEDNHVFIRWKHPFNWSAGQYNAGKHGYYVHTDYDKSDFKIDEAGTGPRAITKIEEAQLLQDIRNYVIPETAEVWNKVCKYQTKWKNFVITPEQISQKLRKIGHAIHATNDLTTTDVVRYAATIEEPRFIFTFEGYKQVNRSNKLIVMVGLPDGNVVTMDPKGDHLGKRINAQGDYIKENYNEPPDETGLPAITKKEEMEALQYIRTYMIPLVLKYHNGVSQSHNQVSEEELSKALHLSGKYPSHNKENPSIGFVSVPRGLYFSFMVHKQLQPDVSDYGKLYVRFRTPDTFSPHDYYVGSPPRPIYEGIKVVRAAAPRIISKMEEHQALQYISNTLIPAAFNFYNNQVMGEFRVRNESDIRKALRKVDIKYTPNDGYETIYYEAKVMTAGGQRVQKFTFYTKRTNRPGMLNRIRAGVNIEGYISQEFYIGDPAYMQPTY